MSRPFSRTLRWLETDRSGRPLVWLAGGLLLAAAWVAWLVLARVPVYAVSSAARLEVAAAARPVEAPVAGRVAEVRASLGQEVAAGEVLFVLDPEALGERVGGQRERLAALERRRQALAAQAVEAERALAAEEASAAAALAEARARVREAEAAARQAAAEVDRLEQLAAAELASAADLERARAQAEQRREAVAALGLAADRHAAEGRARVAGRRGEVDRLGQERAQVAAEAAAAGAELAESAAELGRRTVRAPVAGRIGELAAVPPGSRVEVGERLASVVPPGPARAVAFFPPAEALGRIRPGQRARLRLAGFPAAQYGTLPATVTGVAAEVRADAGVRVELALSPGAPAALPVEHGLPAVAEVEVERLSPAVLLLRTTGGAVGGGG
ncbi:MAG TPA: HlyD family efflux transporter periplasmic adaptor subunit [Thermoanaerobaculia bacterium]